MSAAEQDRNRKEEPGQGAGSSGAAFSPGQADASFDQLLAQLEAEQPVTGGGVSQIFSVPPAAREPGDSGAPAFTPQGGVAGVNASAAQFGQTTGASPVNAPPKQPAPIVPPEPEQVGEFTRIFTQLPTPRSAPPAILADVSAPPALAPQPGEFTQFFQTLHPPKPAASIPAVSAPPLAPVEAQKTEAPAAQAFQPAPPARSQAFAPAPAASAAPPRPHDAHAQEPAAAAAPQPGAFTAFFQAAASAAPAHEPAASRALPPAGEAPQHPAFAEPARRQPASAGGFTELLQSLGGESGPAPRTSSATPPSSFSPDKPDSFSPVAAPAPQTFAPRTPERSPAFAAPPPSQQPAAASGRPGEFTQLMQSLASPSSTEPKPGTPPQAPFFSTGAQVSSGGPSEFTRVIQGSAARSGEAPVATFAPAPQGGGGAAVGLPIAAPQMAKPAAPALPAAEGKTKLQAMMPWLLAINGVLLLLLIALAFLFLRRH